MFLSRGNYVIRLRPKHGCHLTFHGIEWSFFDCIYDSILIFSAGVAAANIYIFRKFAVILCKSGEFQTTTSCLLHWQNFNLFCNNNKKRKIRLTCTVVQASQFIIMLKVSTQKKENNNKKRNLRCKNSGNFQGPITFMKWLSYYTHLHLALTINEFYLRPCMF